MKSIFNNTAQMILLILLVSCAPNSNHTIPVTETSPDIQSPYENLPFDEYLEITYRDLKLRAPEQFIELGLDSIYDIVPLELNNVSIEYEEETYQLYRDVLAGLDTYHFEDLSSEQKDSYHLYKYYLENFIASYDYRYIIYIETGWELTSTSFFTEFYFTDTQVIENLSDAQDYLSRLEKVDEKFRQLTDTLDYRREQGYVIPGIQVPRFLDRISQVANARPQDTPYYIGLEGKLSTLDWIDEQEKKELLDSAYQTISDEIIPAYQTYLAFLEALSTESLPEDGIWQYDENGEYYQYLLEHYTSTSLSADEIHQLGLQELDRIHQEMREVFDSLGYSKYLPLESLYAKAAGDDGVLFNDNIRQEYERILSSAEQGTKEAFIHFPQTKIVIKDDPIGGFYLPASLDGSRPGAFYARNSGQFPRYVMPSLTYHEAIPGHHMQIALAQELDIPTFRRAEINTGFSEGWALYAERLAYELGWYQDDPYGNLGRLQYEAMRAARLVIDTGIHSMGWNFNEAVDFFITNTGFSRNYAQGQVYRFIAYPGQATAYMVGMLTILILREQVKVSPNQKDALKEFHNLILMNGSVPLQFLEQKVLDSIDQP